MLQLLAVLLQESGQDFGEMSAELPTALTASRLDMCELEAELSALADCVERVEVELEAAAAVAKAKPAAPDPDCTLYAQRLGTFGAQAREALRDLRARADTMHEEYASLLRFCGEEEGCSLAEFFGALSSFGAMLDKARREEDERQQRRRLHNTGPKRPRQ